MAAKKNKPKKKDKDYIMIIVRHVCSFPEARWSLLPVDMRRSKSSLLNSLLSANLFEEAGTIKTFKWTVDDEKREKAGAFHYIMCQGGGQLPRKTGARSRFPSFSFPSSPARFLFSSPQPSIIDVISLLPESGFRLRDLWLFRLEGRIGAGVVHTF